MTAPTTEPAPPPPPDPGAAPARPRPTGVLLATAVIATIGVVVALLGIGILLLPVSTPTQDCGTSLGFLLDGRVNEFVSVDDPPAGITPAEALANNETPCRDRVADRVKPAAVLIGAGLVAALGATVAEITIRLLRRSKRRRPPIGATTARAEAPGTGDPTAPPAPPIAPPPPAN